MGIFFFHCSASYHYKIFHMPQQQSCRAICKILYDHLITTFMWAEWHFHRIWIMLEISFVTWTTGETSVCPLYALNICHAELIVGYIKFDLHFLLFLDTKMAQVVGILRHGRQGPDYPALSLLSCWCSGNARGQGISIYGIDLILPEYSGFIFITLTWNCQNW